MMWQPATSIRTPVSVHRTRSRRSRHCIVVTDGANQEVQEVRRVVDVGRWWLMLSVGVAPLALLVVSAVVVAMISVYTKDRHRQAHCLKLVKALLGPLTPATRQRPDE
jgi:hypothetical protein